MFPFLKTACSLIQLLEEENLTLPGVRLTISFKEYRKRDQLGYNNNKGATHEIFFSRLIIFYYHWPGCKSQNII